MKLFKSALIYDGTGSDAFKGDILVDNDRIVKVSEGIQPEEGWEIVDLNGLSVAPGFIDAHSHNDWFAIKNEPQKYFEPFIRQGITSFVAGNCGLSAVGFEADSQHVDKVGGGLFSYTDTTGLYPTVSEFFSAIDRNTPCNIAVLAGITLQDIQKFSKYDPKTDWNNSDAEDYKNTKDYISGKSFLKEIKDDNGEVIDYETSFVEAVEGTPITMTQTTYTYIAKDYFNNYMYNMIFKDNNDESQSKQYWLASRSTYLQETICNYDVLTIENGIIKRRTFGNSSNWDSGTQLTLSVSVIVSLDYDIKTTGQDENGVWQLDI